MKIRGGTRMDLRFATCCWEGAMLSVTSVYGREYTTWWNKSLSPRVPAWRPATRGERVLSKRRSLLRNYYPFLSS